jgi:transposase
MSTREEILACYAQGPDAVVDLVGALQDAVGVLSLRVKQLEDRLDKDSHNSSKPPSSDGFKKPNPKSLRGKSGRSSGGQKGHPGRTLEFAENPERVVVHHPAVCKDCGVSLADVVASETKRRQVFDLPPLKLEVVEHQAHACPCPACGALNQADFPAGVAQQVQYGPGVKALGAYLMHFQLLPYERVVALMDDLFDAPLSEGTLFGATQEASDALQEVEEATVAALKAAKTAHFDETGQRIGGKLNWLHVTSTARLTYYESHPKRGKAALDTIGILPVFTGRAIHDGWSAYRHYECAHSLCNAHHLRELTAVFEQQRQDWAGEMKTLLVEIKHAVDAAKEKGQTTLHVLRVSAFEGRYRKLLKAGYKANPPPVSSGKPGRDAQGSARNLLLRLDTHQSSVLAFMSDFSVPFDNNQAERDLRMMKVKQKVSGGFRSQEGADAFNRIRGYISTLRKQSQKVFSALRGVFSGQPLMPDLTP